jgi:hypothetical protein
LGSVSQAVASTAKGVGLKTQMDGARLMNAAVKTAILPAVYGPLGADRLGRLGRLGREFLENPEPTECECTQAKYPADHWRLAPWIRELIAQGKRCAHLGHDGFGLD